MSLYERLNELEFKVKKLTKENDELKSLLDHYNKNANNSERLLKEIVELLQKNNEILIQNNDFGYSAAISNDAITPKKNKDKKEEVYIPAIDISNMNLSGEETE